MSAFEKFLTREAYLSVTEEVAVALDNRSPKNCRPEANPFGECRSASLRLHKYLRLGDIGVRRVTHDQKGNTDVREMDEPVKQIEVDAIVQTYRRGEEVFRCGEALYVKPAPLWRVLYSTTEANLSVALTGGVHENANIAMHRHFNAVCLSGSALKGVTLDQALSEWREAPKTQQAEIADRIRRVFGFPTKNANFDTEPATTCGGVVAFLDAYPEKNSELVADITTCHHPRYYKGERQDACDNEEPNPVPFLALKRGARFRFMLAPLRRAMPEDMDAAERWLIRALTENGIGAKTAAGYGWFSFNRADSDATYAEHCKELQDRETKKRQAAEEARMRLVKEMEAKRKAEETARKAAMTPEERIREWALKWHQTNFNQAQYDRLTETEKLDLIRLFIHDPEPIWKAIVMGAETGKKKDKERFGKLRTALNALRKAHSAEVGGKLKNTF